jgi:thiol-disulfide isomerase/thioredoxin
MIDKGTRGDYQKLMRQPRIFLGVIAGALIWAGLSGGVCPAAAQVQDGNPGRGGETLEIKAILSRDRTTAIEFYSPYCPPCVKMAPILEQLAARLPEVMFVRVNLNRPGVQAIDWKSPLARQYRIKSIPYFMIFNSQGMLAAEGPAARKTIQDWKQKTGVGRQVGK